MIDQPKIWDFGEEVNGLPVAMLLGMYFEKKSNKLCSEQRQSVTLMFCEMFLLVTYTMVNLCLSIWWEITRRWKAWHRKKSTEIDKELR